MPRVLVRTTGCQMNVHDSEKLVNLLLHRGWSRARDLDQADLLLINTCSIREKAEHHLYSDLGQLREWKAEHGSLPAPRVRASAAVGPEEPTPVVRIATPSIERPPTDSTAALPTPRRNIARESASSADRDPNAIALATAAEPAPAPPDAPDAPDASE